MSGCHAVYEFLQIVAEELELEDVVVPHGERGVFVDGFAGEEETLRQASLVAFGGLSSSAALPCAVAGEVSLGMFLR